MGTPANILGCQYLVDAIMLGVTDRGAVYAITKAIYPNVAQKNKTKSNRVERAIRHSIEIMWERGDPEEHHNMFENSIDLVKGRPSNSEFIARVADYIRLGE